MPPKTNTERIVELLQRVEQLGTKLDERSETFRDADGDQQANVKALEKANEALIQRIAVLEEKCANLQRGSDRAWQVWLALIGAGLSLVISLVKK